MPPLEISFMIQPDQKNFIVTFLVQSFTSQWGTQMKLSLGNIQY